MKLVLACNWDPALPEVAARYGVAELFGKLETDPVGGGRASFILPRVGRREVADYVKNVRDLGISFNYLLNGTTMGNRELTRAGQREIRELLSWISDIGVTDVTVSMPFLAGIIRRNHPKLDITVSMMAGINSVEQALYWREEGAKTVILFDSKDFPLFKAVKEQTDLEVELAANLSCMNRCHQTQHHGAVASLSSQKAGLFGGYSLPVCELRCTRMKMMKPRRLLAGQWIRPEDLRHYEELGLDRLKILDRISPTPELERTLRAYAERRWQGNLAELIPGYRQSRMTDYTQGLKRAAGLVGFLRPDLYDLTEAPGFKQRNRQPRFVIDNQALDGFIQGFMKRDCRYLSCDRCGYCDRWAEKAVRFPDGERETYLENSRENLDRLESGRFFSRRLPEKKS